MVNRALLSSLPQGKQATAHVACYLMEYSATGEGAIAWSFLYNPQIVETAKAARYGSQVIDGGLPTTEYGGPDLRTVTLSNLLLRGWFDGKDMGPLAEGIERLTKATENSSVSNQAGDGSGFVYSSPPVLSFVMGGRSVISPCVVTETNRSESAWWDGGQIAEAVVGFTLREVSKDDLIG